MSQRYETEHVNRNTLGALFGALLILLVLLFAPISAHATSINDPKPNGSIVVGIEEIGGVIYTTYATPLDGNPFLEIHLSSEGPQRTQWGSSWARAQEVTQFFYHGYAFAAGNIHQGQRIVSVCIWFERSNTRVSGEACSVASSATGQWMPGSVAMVFTNDSIIPGHAATTILNHRVGRAAPNALGMQLQN